MAGDDDHGMWDLPLDGYSPEVQKEMARLERRFQLEEDPSEPRQRVVETDPDHTGQVFKLPDEPAPLVFDPVTGQVRQGYAIHMLGAHVDVRNATEIQDLVAAEYRAKGPQWVEREIRELWVNLFRLTSRSINPDPALVSGPRLIDGDRDEAFWFIPYNGSRIQKPRADGQGTITETRPMSDERKAAVVQGVLDTAAIVRQGMTDYLYACIALRRTKRTEKHTVAGLLQHQPDDVARLVEKYRASIEEKLSTRGIPLQLEALVSFTVGEGLIHDNFGPVRAEEKALADAEGRAPLQTVSSVIVCPGEVSARLKAVRELVGAQTRSGDYPDAHGRVYTDEQTIRTLLGRLAKQPEDPDLERLAGRPVFVEQGLVGWGKRHNEHRYLIVLSDLEVSQEPGFVPVFGGAKLEEHDARVREQQERERSYKALLTAAPEMRRRYMLKRGQLASNFFTKQTIVTPSFLNEFFSQYQLLAVKVWGALGSRLTTGPRARLPLTSGQAVAIERKISLSQLEPDQKEAYVGDFKRHLTPRGEHFAHTFSTEPFQHSAEYADVSTLIQYAFNDRITSWSMRHQGVDRPYEDHLLSDLCMTSVSDVALDYLESTGKIALLTSRQQTSLSQMNDTPDPHTAHIFSPTDLEELIAVTAWALALKKTGLKDNRWIETEYDRITSGYVIEKVILGNVKCTYQDLMKSNPNKPQW